MENKQQSSIDWLENEIDFIMNTYSYNSQDYHLVKAFEKAKAMHKEEMRDLYLSHVTKAERLRVLFEKQFEEYYTNTFGGEQC